MSKAWSQGSNYKWRKMRQTVLNEANHRCQIRLPGICTTKATCVHHTIGKRITGDNPKYLKASCTECNQAIGDPTQRRHDPSPTPTTIW